MMKKSLAAVSYDHKNRLQFSDTSLSVLASRDYTSIVKISQH